MKRFYPKDAVLFACVIVSIVLFTLIYPRLYVAPCVNLTLDREEVAARADSIFTRLGYHFEDYKSNVQLKQDNEQYTYLQKKYGISHARKIVSADSVPVFRWEYTVRVSSVPGDSMNIVIGPEDRNPQSPEHGNLILMQLDMKGRLVLMEARKADEYWSPGQDNSDSDPFTYAETLASEFLGDDFSNWVFDKKTDFERPDSPISIYSWERNAYVSGEKTTLSVTMRQNRAIHIAKYFSMPPGYTSKKPFVLHSSLFLMVAAIMSIVLFIKRLRSDLIDLKVALVPAFIVMLFWGVELFSTIYLNTLTMFSAASVFSFLITSLFLGGGMWVMFGVGESLTREVWPQKLNALDYLRRNIFPSAVSRSLVAGISLGFVIAGISVILEYVFVSAGMATLSITGGLAAFYSHGIPWLFGLKQVYAAMFFIAALCFIGVPFVKKYIRWPIAGYIFLVLLASPESNQAPGLDPVYLHIIIGVAATALYIYFFHLYDIVAVFLGCAAVPAIFYGYAGLVSTSTQMQIQGVIILAILAGILLFALLIKNREPGPEKAGTFVPDYLQRIYERERQEQELEIARNVQLRFLPQSVPGYKEIDVASMCVPAMETGGDYYDFIRLGPDKLGIAIGDVSGKGISAAFYMTLTKGFLLSHARLNLSPREVLINLNELFYQNVQRGVFISMIYGVFDFAKSRLVVARAGHNPMMLFSQEKGSIDDLISPGLGLGLEKGEIFAKNIKDIVVPLSSGDTCFFYTDGLNEARNVTGAEFGEERIRSIIAGNSMHSAEHILNAVHIAVDQFAQGTEQHDDMTAVIVKML